LQREDEQRDVREAVGAATFNTRSRKKTVSSNETTGTHGKLSAILT
jgi:hypothetical protein